MKIGNENNNYLFYYATLGKLIRCFVFQLSWQINIYKNPINFIFKHPIDFFFFIKIINL